MAKDKVAASSISRVCGQCHMTIAPFAPQVIAGSLVYHRECYEAWYVRRHGEQPALMPGTNGDRYRCWIRKRAA